MKTFLRSAVCVLGMLCATACKSEPTNAGGMAGAGTSAAESGAGTAAGNAGTGAAAGTDVDRCAVASAQVDEYLDQHSTCRVDSDCAVVGSCSGGFGFRAVEASAADGAQALSNATPEACGVYDGPIYEAICRRPTMTDSTGKCELLETGRACGEVPAESTICDGSSAIRLGFNMSGGFVTPVHDFIHPYGVWFGVVDGMCRFWASVGSMQGIYTGTLTEEEANSLAQSVQYGRIASWTGHYGNACSDAGTALLASPSGAATCRCGCDGAPAGAATAFSELYGIVEHWVARGKPVDGGVSALAYVDSDKASQSTSATWPLARRIMDVPGLVSGESNRPVEGARFEAGPDAASLRKLRSDTYAADKGAMYTLVRESDATLSYQLYVRDDLPRDTARAISNLLQTAASR